MKVNKGNNDVNKVIRRVSFLNKSFATAILVISVLAMLTAVASAGEQLYVNETGWYRAGGAFNASGTPIQHAIDNATAGDSIYVYNGSYIENVYVNKAHLTLQGEGRDVVTVTAESAGDHVFE